jgi:hypothetical protein
VKKPARGDKAKSNLLVMRKRDIRRWKGFREGGYVGEIRHDASVSPPVYHYLVTGENSNEILVWAQERSADGARRALQSTLHQLANRPQRHKA